MSGDRRPTIVDHEQSFRAAMAEQGIVYHGPIEGDGRLRRVHAEGDRKGSRNAWYIAHFDDHPAGAFGCCKRYGNETRFTWSSKETRSFTAAEKREWRQKLEQARAEREAKEQARRTAAAELANQIWEASEPAEDDHPYLQRKAVKSHGLKVGVWTVTNPDTGQVSVVSKLALLVPIRASRTEIHSLQAIFPSDRNILKRDKDYLKDGAKHGLFFTIGQQLVDNVILICEGYATGASLHEATGHLVVVAFDASNLKPVAETFRKRCPDARIVLCADNDAWTETPIKNPGVTRAIEAADAINGVVAIPKFKDVSKKPTDYNDLACLEGNDTVKAAVDAIVAVEKVAELTAPPAKELAPPPPEAPPAPADATLPPRRPAVNLTELEKHGRFTILGYDHGTYFIFHFGKKQILAYTKSDFTDNGLIEIASINFWEEHFPTDKGIDKKAAFDWFINVAHARGIYDIDYIRGRGAWFDDGRIVFHHGQHLSIDGAATPITEIDSRYVYELNKPLPVPAQEALSDAEGRKILELAKMFRWTKPASAALLVGWTFLAPICGALRWRPHVWLTGGPGCGKSTILNQFVHALVQESGIFAQGNSTEAGIRQTLKADAIPVMFDETEQNEDSEKRRVQQVLALIRQASTESQARTLKGTAGGDAMQFHVRSMFCLATIQVGIKHQADIERLTLLILRRKDDSPEAVNEWQAIKNAMYSTLERDKTLSRKMLRRAIDLLPIIHKNIEVFAEAAAERFGSQREGDQYGTLLAGAWSLVSSAPATRADADRLIATYDWSEHREKAESDDSLQALSALTESHIRVQGGADVTVYELICAASEVGTGHLSKEAAEMVLLRYGMRIKDGYLVLSNSSHELRRLMEGTTFEADLRGMLLRVPGADRNENKPMKFNGVLAKCIRIPVASLIADEPKKQLAGQSTDSFWDK